jgi:hypothetical protein
MKIRPLESWTIGRLLCGEPSNGELSALDGPFRRLADHLAALPLEARQGAWDGFLCASADPDAVVNAVAGVDPSGPPPEAEPVSRCATLADVRRLVADTEWPWPGWLAAGVLNALAADPGTGKTIMAADLARRLWSGSPWPDNQPNPLPKGTRTLWVPGDRHFVQLIGLADKFALPDQAMLFNSAPDNPTAGLDLDDPGELAALGDRIRAESPGLVIVDTVGMTTARNLCRPEDARAYFGPLMDMARDARIPFLLWTHLSRDAQALGRRIVGACRLVWKMTQPDPEGQPDRRRVWVDKTYAVKPPALGMTIGNAGCSFDFNPPAAPEPSKGGRPPEKLEKAIGFLTEKLGAGDRRWCDLITEWEASREAKGTLFNAVRAMRDDGRLVIDETVKPKICRLVKNSENGQ